MSDAGTRAAVALRRDTDRAQAWTLELAGTAQSHVDLADPTALEFEYVRRLAYVVDLAGPRGAPLSVLHLGGGGLTLARYVAVTRPGSRQRAVEVDAEVTDLVRRELPLPAGIRLRVQTGDAREVVTRRATASQDVVVSDVFAAARVPARCTTVEYLAELARVLRPGGVVALNVADGPPLRWIREQVAAVATQLAYVALIGEPAVLRGRRFGNLVVVGSRRPLPEAALRRRLAGDPVPARLVAGADLDRFVAGAPPLCDATAADSPPPPEGLLG